MSNSFPKSAVTDVSSKEAAIADLQSRVAFQEDTLQALNQVIADQDAGIRQLQKQVQLLNKKLNDVASNIGQGGSADGEETPPHY
jgi:SlyX protein